MSSVTRLEPSQVAGVTGESSKSRVTGGGEGEGGGWRGSGRGWEGTGARRADGLKGGGGGGAWDARGCAAPDLHGVRLCVCVWGCDGVIAQMHTPPNPDPPRAHRGGEHLSGCLIGGDGHEEAAVCGVDHCDYAHDDNDGIVDCVDETLEQTADCRVLGKHRDTHVEECEERDEQARCRPVAEVDEVANGLAGGVSLRYGLPEEGDDHERHSAGKRVEHATDDSRKGSIGCWTNHHLKTKSLTHRASLPSGLLFSEKNAPSSLEIPHRSSRPLSTYSASCRDFRHENHKKLTVRGVGQNLRLAGCDESVCTFTDRFLDASSVHLCVDNRINSTKHICQNTK